MSHNFAVTIITVSTHGQQACISNSHFTSIGREAAIQDYLEEHLARADVSYIMVLKTDVDMLSTTGKGIFKKYARSPDAIHVNMQTIVAVEVGNDHFRVRM